MNCVVQGPGAEAAHAAELARLAGAAGVEPLAATAFRLPGAQDNAALRERCRELRLDCAFVPEGRRLAELKLLAIDMDSTLVTIESIDEMGDMLGIKASVARITAQAMRGEIDYAESLRRRVALLAGLEEAALERICEQRMHLSPGAEALVHGCRERGIRTLLVSGGFDFFTARLQRWLGIDAVLSNALELEHGRLTGRVLGPIVDGRAKADQLAEEMRRLGLRPAQALAVGDGANDIPMMQVAGTSVAYRAKPAVRAHATHALDYAPLDGVLYLFDWG